MTPKKKLITLIVDSINSSGLSPMEIITKVYTKFLPSLRLFEQRKPARSKHFMQYVRDRPCILCGCSLESDPHHHGRHAMSQKTDDYRAIPLCHKHHMIFHSQGYEGLEGWTKEDFTEHSLTLLVEYVRGLEGT